MPTTATTGPRRRLGSGRRRAAAPAVLIAALLLAACGSSGGSDGPKADADASPTTAAAPADTTTTEADAEEEDDAAGAADEETGLPTSEADAPSGDWISVRFNVAIEPEPDDYIPGNAEARLYDIEPDCSGSGPCRLTFSGGGDGGTFGMPDTAEIAGDPVPMEPDGDAWTDSYDDGDPIACTAELDGPYLATAEERSLEPVYGDDGEVSGLVGTLLFTDTLTDEGRAAGCPASAEATYAYAVVVAPNDGLRGIDEYTVDGTFRQTLEVTAAKGQIDPQFQEGGLSTTLPDHDIELDGSCADGECSVELTQVNGDGNTRVADLVSEDGRSLLGTYDDNGGCVDDETGELVFEEGAYASSGAYQDLTPIWIEDGQVKAFVGRYAHVAKPTELGKTDPSCSTEQTVTGWVYLVDTSILG